MEVNKRGRGRPRTAKFIENSSYASTVTNVKGANEKVDNPLVAAKIKKLQLEAENLNLKNGVLKKSHVSIHDVAKEVATEYSRVRQQLLSMTASHADILAQTSDVSEVRRILEAEFNNILSELSADNNYSNIAKEVSTTNERIA